MFSMDRWLEETRILQRDYYTDPSVLPPKEFIAWTRNMVLGLIVEATEALGEVKDWRWWKSAPDKEDRFSENTRALFLEELVDITHFVGALAISVGCTDEEWARIYAEKSETNRDRQRYGGA